MDRDKKIGYFRTAKCKIQLDFKVQCMDIYEKLLIFGDDKGNIACYELNESSNILNLETSINIAKGKVEQLKCHPIINIAFILISGSLYIVTLPKLEKVFTLDIKEVTKFSLNSHQSRVNELAVILKTKKLKFFEYNHEMRKLIPGKNDECKIAELPDFVEYYENYLMLISVAKKKVFLIKNNGQTKPLDNYDMTYCKNVDGSWLIYFNNIGLFLEKKGDLKGQNTIDFGNKPLVCINTFKNFIISLHDSVLKVYESKDSNFIEDYTFPLGSTGRFLAIGSKYIFYLTENFSERSKKEKDSSCYDLFVLLELAYELQIDKLISEEKYEDAIHVFNNNIDSIDEEKPKKLEQFFLDCAWSILKKGDFKSAMKNFKLSNFDPSALIYIFCNELKIKLKDEKLEAFIKSKNYSIETITSNNSELIKEGLMLLYTLILDKRNFFLHSYANRFFSGDIQKAFNSNQKISFPQSNQAMLIMDDYEKSFAEHLTLINTSIVKIMILQKSKFKLVSYKEIICSDYFTWNKEDLLNFLTTTPNKDEANLCLAYLYEKQENWEAALKIWQEFGLQRESLPEFSTEGKDRTVEILKTCKDKELTKEFINWVILKFPEDAFKLVINLSTEIINIEAFYTQILGSIDKSNTTLNVKEKFLEYYIKNGCINERYFTLLCEIYVDKLFKLKKQNTEIDISNLDGAIKIYYEKLENILKNTNLYNKVHILDKIKDSWMIEFEIFLYSSLNMHYEALSKLVQIGVNEDNFEKAERYCINTKSDGVELFSEMFKILTKQYEISQKAALACRVEQDRVSLEKTLGTCKKQILILLRKYGDNQKLNIFQILENIPGEWLLTERKDKIKEGDKTYEDHPLYDFLIKIIKNSNHMSNKYKIARSLAEMSLLFKEKEILEAKNRSITIGNDTNCELCRKKIGSTIFVIYPNMKIYHTKCATNLSVCPSTRYDFSKNKQYF